jgi:hypothetical protein
VKHEIISDEDLRNFPWDAPQERAATPSSVLAPPAGWPNPLGPEAYHGCAGCIVKAILPHTEADPVAILIQLLAGFGNLIGRRAHFSIPGGVNHYTNLFVALVGRSSRSRKGTSWANARGPLKAVDPKWDTERITSGLSSGEGLITAVRDRSSDDPGIDDKRLLVQEPEFANVLKNADRQGNILSVILRQGWDDGFLQVLTRNSPIKATGAHISVIGHITNEELKRCLTANDQVNGFANRFLWMCVGRSKLLPLGGTVTGDLTAEIQQLTEATERAGSVGRMQFDIEAQDHWTRVYGQLSSDRPGLLGAVTSRSEAQTLRLACIYALLDGSETISDHHLRAALALWRYSDDSAAFIFGDAVGDKTADLILSGLKKFPNGLTRDEVRNLIFGGHERSDEITRALDVLQRAGRIESTLEPKPKGSGRRPVRWRLIPNTHSAWKAW